MEPIGKGPASPPGPSLSPQPGKPARSAQPGLLAALTDTRFTIAATPLLVRWIYSGCAVIIGLVTLISLSLSVFALTWEAGWVWGVFGLAASPLIGLIWLLAIRVACEFTLSRFRR